MKTSVQKVISAIVIKNVVITGIVITSGISAGLAVGIVLGKMLSTKAYTFDAPIDTGLETDYTALMERYNSDPNVENFKPNEVANISWLKFAAEEHTHSVAHCMVTAAIVKQKVCSHDVRDGDRWYSESVFYSSIKKGGFRFYQNGKDGNVFRYTAANPKENCTAEWSTDTEYGYTNEEFETAWGKTLDRPIIYIMSDKTVVEESLEVVDNKWVIELELDPVKANERYSRQMISMSNLEQPPTFHLLHLTFTIDQNFNLEQVKIHEKYTVYVVGKNDSDATNVIDFYHNSTETIPDLETDYTY
ncbi:MAG: hypothetical protein J5511_01180 [Bacilli bacterium]|nr:hypothetical protein [Bacilli bacterium]